jgi:rhodanese-related sulfurtransferase
MITIFKRLFRTEPGINFSALIGKGAIILDVRSHGEFRKGHIKRAINIPLETLRKSLSVLKKDRIIIACCASGTRSTTAAVILTENGFANVYNGGAWMRLQNKIR